MEKIVRNKRKCVTIIKGLDMFGKHNVISSAILVTHLSLVVDFRRSPNVVIFVSCFCELRCEPGFAGIKLSEASKKLGKKFASGASVVKVISMTLVTCY